MTTQKQNKVERRKPRFSGSTKGIRLRIDQMEALERLFIIDPELDWSKAVRRGIDLFIAERTGQYRTPQSQVPVAVRA
jgi:hypothetical protein